MPVVNTTLLSAKAILAKSEAEFALEHLAAAIELITYVRDAAPRRSEERTLARSIGVALEKAENEIKDALLLIGD